MEFNPTEEQIKVIQHVDGHARVLAIAGSGKTTTMIYRIKNLVEQHKVNPKSIRVLMFNRKAADDFKNKSAAILPGRPYISTFHSFSYQFIETVIADGNMPKMLFWTDDDGYQVNNLLNKTLNYLKEKKTN